MVIKKDFLFFFFLNTKVKTENERCLAKRILFFCSSKKKRNCTAFLFRLGLLYLMKAKKKTIERDCLKDLMRYHS